ncbi:hypothetical protein [Cumulibacter soli]|uniref:hypothetical protein n=1 Tax=Cumulibacter soli TaxID=2546344 RepID=UPI001068A326|nr:hypothetical protein [Cumulibacter soli]
MMAKCPRRRLWIRAARAGQVGALDALRQQDLQVAFEQTALRYPRWARSDLAQAQVLAAYGREQLIRQVPHDLAHELDHLNRELNSAVLGFAERWYGGSKCAYRRAATFAMLDLPASAIRRYLLAGKAPPKALDDVILAASHVVTLHWKRLETDRGRYWLFHGVPGFLASGP